MKILLWCKRRERKMSLRKLQEKTKLGRTTINNIENGKKSPTMDQMEKIAQALDLCIEDLYESDQKKNI